MDAVDAIEVTPELRVPVGELTYRASRAGGPGGQHVNTSSTRVELWWDVAGSPSLTPEQRALLLARLGTRLDSAGWLRLVAAGSRSQARNRDEVTERFRVLVAEALKVVKPRKRTRTPRAVKKARIEAKRRRGAVKRERRSRTDYDE